MEPNSSESLRTISTLLAPALELLTLGTSTLSPQTESRLLVITISYHWLLFQGYTFGVYLIVIWFIESKYCTITITKM